MSHIHDGMLIYSAWKVKSSFNAICGISYWLKTKNFLCWLIFWKMTRFYSRRNFNSEFYYPRGQTGIFTAVQGKGSFQRFFQKIFILWISMWNNVRYIQNRPGVETRWLRRLYLWETVFKVFWKAICIENRSVTIMRR